MAGGVGGVAGGVGEVGGVDGGGVCVFVIVKPLAASPVTFEVKPSTVSSSTE